MNVDVTSEVGRLRGVVIHVPGPEWDLIPLLPGTLEDYLIEDIFVLQTAQDEHKVFVEVLSAFVDKDGLHDFQDLLASVCEDNEARNRLIAAVCAQERMGISVERMLLGLESEQLAATLIQGAHTSNRAKPQYENLFRPLPNLMFTRDIGAVVPGGFCLAYPRMPARRREGVLMRYVADHHPLFKGLNKIDIRDYANYIFWGDLRERRVFLEGGDLLVVSADTLFVGAGQRTTEDAIALLANALSDEGTPIRNVVLVRFPSERAQMHLDTILTFLGLRECLAYRPLIAPMGAAPVSTSVTWELLRMGDGEMKSRQLSTFQELLAALEMEETEILSCGGPNRLFQTREQWTDGANVLALAPGVVVGYARNVQTTAELSTREYRYISLEEPERKTREEAMAEVVKVAEAVKRGENVDKVMIGLPGSELSRARGGPRCMSMPIARDRVHPEPAK